MVTQQRVLLTLVGASLMALGLAYYVQFGLGYPPCSLCERARLPHAVLIVGGSLALYLRRPRAGLVFAAAALFTVFVISITHVGVEHGWLPLPEGCQAATTSGSLAELRSSLLAQTRPSCDQPGPSFAGLSMAAWHALVALALAFTAALALGRQAPRTR